MRLVLASCRVGRRHRLRLPGVQDEVPELVRDGQSLAVAGDGLFGWDRGLADPYDGATRHPRQPGDAVFHPPWVRPVMRLMATATTKVPKKYDSRAWPIAMRREGVDDWVTLLALYAIPIENAVYAKSL